MKRLKSLHFLEDPTSSSQIIFLLERILMLTVCVQLIFENVLTGFLITSFK